MVPGPVQSSQRGDEVSPGNREVVLTAVAGPASKLQHQPKHRVRVAHDPDEVLAASAADAAEPSLRGVTPAPSAVWLRPGAARRAPNPTRWPPNSPAFSGTTPA